MCMYVFFSRYPSSLALTWIARFCANLLHGRTNLGRRRGQEFDVSADRLAVNLRRDSACEKSSMLILTSRLRREGNEKMARWESGGFVNRVESIVSR